VDEKAIDIFNEIRTTAIYTYNNDDDDDGRIKGRCRGAKSERMRVKNRIKSEILTFNQLYSN
jgi:hypothetical protein